MSIAPSLPNLDHLPAAPAWVRAWAAEHTRAVSYTLDALRGRVAAIGPRGVALHRAFPFDSIVQCQCGARRCVGYAIVCGIVVINEDHAHLLLRAGPRGDPYMHHEASLKVIHAGGGLTPEQVDVLAQMPLGVC